MSITRAIELILQACVAVAEAHAAGIIHRDLKPQNLFVTKRADGELVKVLDFGISKDTSELKPGGTELTKTEAMLGSPHYMSPEQLKSSKDVDARTDVWSLGVCLFQLLSGKLPYEAPSIAELCLKVLSQPPASLAKLAPSVPAPLVSVVEKCLAQERQQRWANITDLALALEPFADARGKMFIEHVKAAGIAPSSTALPPARIDPHPTSPTVNAWGTASSSPKRRSVIWVVVGGALILGFGATMSYMLARPKSKPIASHAHALVSTAASAAPSVSLVPLATASAPVASASAQPSARPAPARTTTKASGTNKDAGAIDLFQDRN
jgi:serine/threonine-protein kinase